MSAEGFSTHFEEVDNTLEQHSSSITQNATQITTVVTGLTNTGINITDGVIDLHSGTNSWSLKSNGDSMISGWLIKDTRIATDNICLESSNGVMGLYMSVASSANFKNRVSNLEDFIDSNGGIYMQVKAASGSKAASANLAAYDSNGYKVFKLKTEGECNIAGWTFDKNDLFVGNQAYTTDFTPDEFSITLSPKGLFGHQWKFLQNGAGAIAGGNIKWDSNGEVEFGPSVRLHWMNDIAHVDEKVIISQQMAYGKMLYRNPEFANNDLNDVRLYPHNTSCGNMRLATSEIAPNTSGKMLEIVSNQWHSDSDHRLAGFYFANRSRPNAKFVVRIIALIPENWKINNYHNAYGDGGTTKWLTSQEGTGKWEEYLCVVKCGRDGEFNTINHFALSLSENSDYIALLDTGNTNIQLANKNTMDFHTVSAVAWYVAYATVIDLTASDKLTTSIDINGIYTGTLRADQIVSGVIDTKLLNVDDIFANGQIQAKQVLSPFVEITLPNDFGYSGFNVSKAYNSFFAPSESGRYIFLPCDVSQSGRTITIHYSQTDRTSAPIVILCDNINARFLQLYQTQKYSSDDKIRVIQLTAGCTVQLIAIPHRSGYSPDLPENSTNNFVNWYMIGYDAERDIEMVVMRDDIISDELWTDYHNTINGTLLGNA